MKKILLSLLLLLVGAAVFAQHPIGNDSLQLQTTANSNALFKSKGAIGSDSGFVNASYADTTAANRGKIKNYPGALIRTGNTIWLRNSTATMWIDIANSSSGLLIWEHTLNNQGAIPFDFSHTTDMGYNTFALDHLNFFGINANDPVDARTANIFAGLGGAGMSGADENAAAIISLAPTNNQWYTIALGDTPYLSRITIDENYFKFDKEPQSGLSFPAGVAINPKIVYKSDTLLTEPEFVYVSDADTIKKYPFAGTIGDIRDTAKLVQGYGIYINNADSTYQPNKPDVLIAVDTSKIATKYELTIITNSDTAIFIVDSIANTPTGSEPNNTKYLVGTSPTGVFATHENDIAELIGGVWTFTDPTSQQQLIVDNADIYASYQFNGVDWIQTTILIRQNYNRGIGSLRVGTFDKQTVTLSAWDKPALVIDTTRDVSIQKFIGTPSGNYAFIDSATGNIDTGFFRPLIAGTNITITPVGNGDVISATGGGGTFLQADTIIYLSKSAGIVSDADITAGSIAFGTDNTSAIQAILDLAGHTQPVKIIWDVKVSVTGLRIKGNTEIKALPGCGAILRNNSNKSMFINYDTAFGREPVDSNIIINGGIWNGNSYNSGALPAQTAGTAAGGATNVFSFYGVRNLIVRDFIILRQRTYAIHGINVRNGLYENGVINCGSEATLYSDGVHFDGYSENCVGRNLKIRSHDDAIVCNADDLYRSVVYGGGVYGSGPGTYYANAAGPINNIRFENIYLDSSQFGFRILSGASRVDNILVRNLTGNTIGYSAIIDNYWVLPDSVTVMGPGNVGTVTIENDQVNIYGDIAFVKNSLIDINCNVDNLILKDIKRNYIHASVIPTVNITGSATTVRSLVIDGYDCYDTSAFVTSHIYNEGTINSLSISRANVKRRGSSNGDYLFDNVGTVKYLFMNGIKADSMAGVYNNHGLNPITVNAVNVIHKDNNYSFTTTKADTLTLSNYVGTNIQAGTFAVLNGDAFLPNVWSRISSSIVALTSTADNLTIGTTGAVAKFTVSTSAVDIASFASSGGGNAAIYVSSPANKIAAYGYRNAGVDEWFSGNDGAGGVNDFVLLNAGFTRRLALSQAGALTMSGYGAGTITSDASGNWTATSDERVKNSINPYRIGLQGIMKLHPSTYKRNTTGDYLYAGFIAQDVKNAFGGLGVGQNSDGMLTLDRDVILAGLVNAVQEQQKQIEELKAEIKRLK